MHSLAPHAHTMPGARAASHPSPRVGIVLLRRRRRDVWLPLGLLQSVPVLPGVVLAAGLCKAGAAAAACRAGLAGESGMVHGFTAVGTLLQGFWRWLSIALLLLIFLTISCIQNSSSSSRRQESWCMAAMSPEFQASAQNCRTERKPSHFLSSFLGATFLQLTMLLVPLPKLLSTQIFRNHSSFRTLG